MTITNVKVGDTFEYDGHLYRVQNCEMVGDSMLNSEYVTSLEDLETGDIIDKKFAMNEEVEEFEIVDKKMQFSYQDGDLYYFIDVNEYDQLPLTSKLVKDYMQYISEDAVVTMTFAKDKLLKITLPQTVDLNIVEIDDTTVNGYRNAVLETGLNVKVDSDMVVGQKVEVDTETGEIIE